MTRKEIDDFFTEKYSFLLKIARGLCYKKNRKYPPETAITEAYLEVVKNNNINNIDTLQRYVISRITLEITASRSSLNYQDKLSCATDLPFDIKNEDTSSCIIEEYRKQLTDAQKRIVLEAYIELGMSSQRKLAEYFKLSQTTTHFIMKEIKEDIENFKLKKHEAI